MDGENWPRLYQFSLLGRVSEPLHQTTDLFTELRVESDLGSGLRDQYLANDPEINPGGRRGVSATERLCCLTDTPSTSPSLLR